MTHPHLTRAAQVIAAGILLVASGAKFIGYPDSVEIFVLLGMEPTGRYIVACCELTAALLLLSPYAALGSVIAIAVMCGALIAHVSQLGLSLDAAGATQAGLLGLVLLSSAFVLGSRRKELPFIGDTL